MYIYIHETETDMCQRFFMTNSFLFTIENVTTDIDFIHQPK